jgi:hypothetical protein
VARSCNPSYLGGWDQEDWGRRPAPANTSWDPISKITRTGGVTQAVEHLLCKQETLNSNLSPTKGKKKLCSLYHYISTFMSTLLFWLLTVSSAFMHITLSLPSLGLPFCVLVSRSLLYFLSHRCSLCILRPQHHLLTQFHLDGHLDCFQFFFISVISSNATAHIFLHIFITLLQV